jgi:hypothetical protein
MAKRKTVSKPPPKSRAKKPAPIVEAELDKAIADDFDERQKLSEPGRHMLREELLEHHSLTPKLAANDIDAAWDESDGAETVGGHAPTPDQDRVDDLGEAVGLTYADNEPLNFAKVAERDKKRWELNPASAELGDDEDDNVIEEEDLDEIVDDDELGVLGILEDDDEDEDEDEEEDEIDEIVAEDKLDELDGPEDEEEEELDELDEEDDEEDFDLLDDEDDDDEDD